MDGPNLIRLPSIRHEPSDELAHELNAAIDLVASGVVRRIVLSSFPASKTSLPARWPTPRALGWLSACRGMEMR